MSSSAAPERTPGARKWLVSPPTGQINRKDFGLNWNVALETRGVLVSDTVKISLEVQAVKQEA
ncbi:MAG: YceI family protein [Chloroflexi bacterium]|nr:YceI family protein [Chloroflexota bacterium]